MDVLYSSLDLHGVRHALLYSMIVYNETERHLTYNGTACGFKGDLLVAVDEDQAPTCLGCLAGASLAVRQFIGMDQGQVGSCFKGIRGVDYGTPAPGLAKMRQIGMTEAVPKRVSILRRQSGTCRVSSK